MTIDELKVYVKEKSTELGPLTTGVWDPIVVIILTKILADLDKLESDSLTCRKCGEANVIPDDAFDEDAEWCCEECGAIHDVKTILTCSLAPEEEEEDA